MRRLYSAVVIASLLWIQTITQTASSIYCYRGEPPAGYHACLAYNQGIGAQASNQHQLQNSHTQLNNVPAQFETPHHLLSHTNPH